MTLEYSFEDMIKALEKWGYEVKLEDGVEIHKHYFHEEEVPRKVWVVYLNGSSMAEWVGLGARRVEFVFEQEFRTRLLRLV
jgi:hypothetical protein